jgi:hemerythrin-like domain-containing protein
MSSVSGLRIIREEHSAVGAMLRSLRILVDDGPGAEPERFFETVRAILLYMDEFPERHHHPNESRLLFPMLLRVAPQLRPLIEQLEQEHHGGNQRVRELLHLLVGWEFLGEPRRAAFVTGLQEYVRFYLQHMHNEEMQLLPVAAERLGAAERAELDAAFEAARDPFAGGRRDAEYEALFSRIVRQAPAPVGLGQRRQPGRVG